MKRQRATHLFAGWIWIAFVAGLLAVGTRWYTLNISASIPLGLYRYTASVAPLGYGDIVQIHAVSFGRSWPFSWLPLLKPVAGVAGDEVCIVLGNFFIRGVWYGVVYEEAQGHPLPHMLPPGECLIIPAGMVALASTVNGSLDSRYAGLIPIDKTRRAVPVWTWRESDGDR